MIIVYIVRNLYYKLLFFKKDVCKYGGSFCASSCGFK